MINIAFFGTGDFSKNILDSLIQSEKINVLASVSQPDKPVGRKKILTKTPVKILSEEHSVPVYQPKKLRKNEEFFDILRKLELDFIVVVAYGKIVPNEVLTAPKYGCINVHGSILPAYRGASPIQEAIKNGDTQTGVTIMYMSEEMDEGDMLATAEVPINITDTTNDIFTKFEQVSPKLLIKTLEQIKNGEVQGKEQDNSQATYCSKIQKSDGKVDFKNETAKEIYDKHRAFATWPGIFHFYNEKKFAIEKCFFETINLNEEGFKPGDVIELENEHGEKNTRIGIICKEGILTLETIKPEGKKAMEIFDFINGNKAFLEYSFE